jgi:hypothetical protein
VSREDNETRKDPKTIYLFLSTLGNQGKLTQQALLVLQENAKTHPQRGMRRKDDDALNPTGPN